MASTLLKPFTDFPPAIPQTDRDRLKAEAIGIYKNNTDSRLPPPA